MICIDASVAAKWILPEEFSDKADALYSDCMSIGEAVVAPALLPFEVTNILRQRVRRRLLRSADALSLLEQFDRFTVSILDMTGLHRAALALATEVEMSASYDAHYVVLAHSIGCDFWTADKRLLRLLGNRFPFVRPLAEYK